jgi:hypothetical protein
MYYVPGFSVETVDGEAMENRTIDQKQKAQLKNVSPR